MTYQERMRDELSQLEIRLHALRAFLFDSDVFRGLPLDDQELLTRQIGAMLSYRNILQARINRLAL